MILSYLEALIPFNFGIPGIKLGLANLVVVIALYTLGARQAFAISVIRILLVSVTFGNMSAMMYSMAGGLLSFLIMYLLSRSSLFIDRFLSFSCRFCLIGNRFSLIILRKLAVLGKRLNECVARHRNCQHECQDYRKYSFSKFFLSHLFINSVFPFLSALNANIKVHVHFTKSRVTVCPSYTKLKVFY